MMVALTAPSIWGSALLLAVLAGGGAMIALSALPRFRRRSLTERLLPHTPAGIAQSARRRPTRSRRETRAGAKDHPVEGFGRLADVVVSGLGGFEPVATRLDRIGSESAIADFRIRQVAAALAGLVASAGLGWALAPGAIAGLALLLAGPAAGMMAMDRHLHRLGRKWQAQVETELPVVVEQMAMLVDAGYSTGAAMARIARRGRGLVAADLGRVANRVAQGLTETQALGEWAQRSDLASVRRLVRLLDRGTQTTELGRLLAGEARSLRTSLHRLTLARVERRAQTIWIPVTVAALVPGTIFLAVPFMHALTAFGLR
ncbi:MAG: type II secretion system F family protein [Acidimicrobiales bacterium]